MAASVVRARHRPPQIARTLIGSDQNRKALVRDFWDRTPCGTRGNPHQRATPAYFEWIERERDAREPFIARFARWPAWRGRAVLEMGVGAGTDFVKFARAGAKATGVDMSAASAALARTRLALEHLRGEIIVSDVERLPFPDNSFDFVYSWGVIHHTPDTQSAAREVVRVLRPGGRFCVMVYHRRSLVCLQAYLLHGLMRGRPFVSIDRIAATHLESAGTKVYTAAQALELFPDQPVTITHVLTPYDLRYGRSRYLPAPCGALVPSYFGYFLVIEGQKR
jgi:ubiquinone/menaquinone biosynthesis C-methylase UbiE